MSNHTPGPWRFFSEGGKLLGRIYSAAGKTICIFNKSPSEADARLIAAAPDLLEVLQSVADFFDGPTGWTQEQEDLLRGRLHAIIAKAMGA